MTKNTNKQKYRTTKTIDKYSEEWLEWTRNVRSLNDAFRRSFTSTELYCSPGVLALAVEAQAEILERVRAYRSFNAITDPHHNHSQGYLLHNEFRIVWTIYYQNQSEKQEWKQPLNPLDIDLTKRHMMVMLDSEFWEDLPENIF